MKKNRFSSVNKTLFRSSTFYIVITVIFIIFSIICFTWKIWHTLSLELPIETSVWGQFGDFVGGTLGVIFSLISVLLVVRTFIIQNKTAETQRFNDLFFELLRLYQSEVKELNGQFERIVDVEMDEDNEQAIKVHKERVQYNDKDFFDEEKRIVQSRYRNLKSYEKNVLRAVSYYMLFFTDNRSKMAAYYRTLYRIFELIDKSMLIDEYTKKEYAKIVRAQLTESELFFLRYNAMTIIGSKFIKYINKYHLLKHLPAFELLEFKDWWKNMSILEREGINIIYLSICKSIKVFLSNATSDKEYRIRLFVDEKNASRYQITLQSTNKMDFSICLIIDKSQTYYTTEFVGLSKMDETRIQQLLDCFIREIFIYSNFGKFNKIENIQTYSSPIIHQSNIVKINSGIKNIHDEQLVFSPNINVL